MSAVEGRRAELIEVERGEQANASSFQFGNILYSGDYRRAITVGKPGVVFNFDPRQPNETVQPWDLLSVPLCITEKLSDPQEFYSEVIEQVNTFLLEVSFDRLTPEQREEYVKGPAYSTYWISYRYGEIQDISPPVYQRLSW